MYLQTVLDCYSRHARGRLYTSKLPVTSVHVLNETVLPFFEAHEARVYTILPDNGCEFCGCPDHHPTSCFCNWRGLSYRPSRRASHRATALSSERITPCGHQRENDLVGVGGADIVRLGQLFGTLHNQRPHQGRIMKRQPLLLPHIQEGSEIDTERRAH